MLDVPEHDERATAPASATDPACSSGLCMLLLSLKPPLPQLQRVRLSHYEVASRLAYSATDAPPDAELRSAAEAGELETVAALSAHAERLLETEHGRAKVLDFGRFYAALAQRSDPEPAVAALQGLEDAAGLGAAAHAEARRFIEHIVYSGQTFADLMTSTRAFPESSLLAQVR